MKKRVTFKRSALRSDGITPYYQICFGQYLEVVNGQKVWHVGSSIFVSKEEYDNIAVGEEIMFDLVNVA
jgi:hypothetical protein